MAGAKFLLTIKFTTQGDGIGSSVRKEGQLDYSKGLECHGFEYAALTQIDPNSGQPIGRRKHHPVKIRREIDAASPALHQALCTNEVFTKATLSFNRIGADGKPAIAHTVELLNGTVCSYKHFHGQEEGEGTSREQYSTNELEEFELTFQQITFTWVKGGKTSVDNWLAS